ncbi:hypothetical protein DSO57_1020857 [Entomophthora muscae]|uniref:Uncharacterized protein n=1 Tax=Entomophthora muscae TaxID=34485 RepID=A0ACC2UPI9_9FUNG|nr:hypothetical protein DSO57_1020857 [Entomophthora muscae]
MSSPSSWSLAMTQDTHWGLVNRNPTPLLHSTQEDATQHIFCPYFSFHLPPTGAPPAILSAMLHTHHNSDNAMMDYYDLIRKFGICHHEETMYSFVQALHSNEDAMIPIWAGELYHGQYEASHLASEVCLGLQSVDCSS